MNYSASTGWKKEICGGGDSEETAADHFQGDGDEALNLPQERKRCQMGWTSAGGDSTHTCVSVPRLRGKRLFGRQASAGHHTSKPRPDAESA